ncbi:MAG: hypoxanthine phosphoribosyltransferase [Planctomycetales bacterium]
MRTLITEERIEERVRSVAGDIIASYGDRPITILGVLVGSLVFLADLIRQLPMPMKVGLLQAKSYRGTATSPGELTVDVSTLPDLQGQDVLVIDDIFDTGLTLARVVERLQQFEPRSLKTVVLLRKAERRQVDMQPDFVGFDVPNEFVVGYGLDYDDRYRNLPCVAVLEPQDLEDFSA